MSPDGSRALRVDRRTLLAGAATATGALALPAIALADTFHGPWTTLGDLHPTDPSRTSFNSQISSIFRHPGKKDLYIALADRWFGRSLSGPKFDNGGLPRLVQSAFAKRFARPQQPFTPEEAAAMKIAGPIDINTSLARHVWLPIRFDGEHPTIA